MARATMQTSGNPRYRMYSPTFIQSLLGWKWPVKENAVSSAMYVVPVKRIAAEPTTSPKDKGVPSSNNWYPTRPNKTKIQNIAVVKPS